ncbi:MAG TPA: adenylosuccinate lyase, partial [Streptomyces sp.]
MDEADEHGRAVTDRLRAEAAREGQEDVLRHLMATEDDEELAAVLTERDHVLWEREIAAHRLSSRGDRRAFETLVLLLNHRDPARCAAAAHALLLLGDPRTPRAAAALATNTLRTAYALYPVRLLSALRAPESVPALVSTLERLLGPREPHWRVALACVEGLGTLGDRQARPVLEAALPHPRLG